MENIIVSKMMAYVRDGRFCHIKTSLDPAISVLLSGS